MEVTYKRQICHSENLLTNLRMLSRRPINAMSISKSPTCERQILGSKDRRILENLFLELFEANIEVESLHQHPIPRQLAKDENNMHVNDRFKCLLKDAYSDVYLDYKRYSLLSAIIKLLYKKTLGK